MEYQMNCLRNEIDHISKKSIEHNNSPMTVHGQFQNIVGKIDEILNGDIHSINQKLTGLATRDQAKTFIYALMYGAGSPKIAKILNKDLIVAKNDRDIFSLFTEISSHYIFI